MSMNKYNNITNNTHFNHQIRKAKNQIINQSIIL